MNLKQQAAARALEYVHEGMVLGLGSGSTTMYFIDMLGERLLAGQLGDILAVPTSEKTAAQAEKYGIPLTNLATHPLLDLAVDGADEVDPDLNLIKGMGRAHLREKIVEIHAKRFVVIVDESKIVPQLCTRVPLPVEIIQFEAEAHMRWLSSLGCRVEQWYEPDGSPVISDNGNYLVGCWFDEGLKDPYALSRILADRPGIVEHGLFLDMADQVIVAAIDGIRILEAANAR